MEQDRINIFKNQKEGERMPVWKGFATIDGKEYELALRPAKNGKPDVYSGTIKPKQNYSPRYDGGDTAPAPAYNNAAPTKSLPGYEDELDDSIPF